MMLMLSTTGTSRMAPRTNADSSVITLLYTEWLRQDVSIARPSAALLWALDCRG